MGQEKVEPVGLVESTEDQLAQTRPGLVPDDRPTSRRRGGEHRGGEERCVCVERR